MMCSGAELELTTDADGILDLSDNLEVGMPATQVFGAEPVIDFEVTPNRPDWLGVHGIARDLAATGLGTFAETAVTPVPGQFPCPIKVVVDGDACPFFSGRVIRNVKNGPSPQWLQDKLKSIGLKPISTLVDITNYVSYDRCRPLHVYDLSRLTGDTITAGLPSGTSEAKMLDDKTYTVTSDMCTIMDASGVIGLAVSWAAIPRKWKRRPPTSSSNAPGSTPIRTAQDRPHHRHHLGRAVPASPAASIRNSSCPASNWRRN